jgi:amino acid transporter
MHLRLRASLPFLHVRLRNTPLQVPKAALISLPLITLCYMWLNTSFFLTLPLATIDGANTLAVDFAEQIAGVTGGKVVIIGVALSAFGALNGSLFGASRLVHACGRDGTLPEFFGYEVKPFGKPTPLVATCLQATVASILVAAVGKFAIIVQIYIFAQWLFYLATMIGLLYLRRTEPKLQRPFKVPTFLPICFVVAAAFVCGVLLWQSTWQCGVSLGVLVAGVPVKIGMDRYRGSKSDSVTVRSPLISEGEKRVGSGSELGLGSNPL